MKAWLAKELASCFLSDILVPKDGAIEARCNTLQVRALKREAKPDWNEVQLALWAQAASHGMEGLRCADLSIVEYCGILCSIP